MTQSALYQYILDVVLLIIAGLAEYFHLAPANSFYTIFTIVVGHVVGTSLTIGIGGALAANTAATKENTAVQAATPLQAITGTPTNG